MEAIFYILVGVVILGFAATIYLLNKRLKEFNEDSQEDESQKILMEWLKEMRGSLDKNTETMQKQLSEANKTLNERLDNAARVIGRVSKELGEMSEMTRQMKDLQDFLRSPKLRGNIGEQVLRDLLEQVLPREHFSLHYGFKEGQIVDAVIKTERGIIPIDSKFPMENFKKVMKSASEEEKEKTMRGFIKDVKKHVNDISKKYILPQEGTVDFAVMYVPSEPVYYEIAMHGSEINSYAYEKKVLFVSPNSFYYFLKIIMMGLQEKRIAEGARKILETLEAIRHESGKFGDDLSVLSGHVTRAKNAMDNVTSKYQLLSGRIEQVKHLKSDDAPVQFDRAELDGLRKSEVAEKEEEE